MSESLILAVEEHEMLYAPSHGEFTVQFTHECVEFSTVIPRL